MEAAGIVTEVALRNNSTTPMANAAGSLKYYPRAAQQLVDASKNPSRRSSGAATPPPISMSTTSPHTTPSRLLRLDSTQKGS